ncbi:MAG TPA: aminoglycoside phosphotransferase family protein [Candidatus Dormibacteraeota bacterium]
MGSLSLPQNLLTSLEPGDARRPWLDGLPEMVADLARRWSLLVDAPFQPGGETAWVAPCTGDGGDHLVLKVAWRHPEAEHEAAGLRTWNGNAAVRLLQSAELDQTLVLLLERCLPGTTLSGRPEPEQDEVVASLLLRLWIEPGPGHPFRPLEEMCDSWVDEFEESQSRFLGRLDEGLVREGCRLFRLLPRTAGRRVLLCTDLHAANILAAEREPWLMIDPKPYVGDPTYDALQHLFNCRGRLLADPEQLVTRMAGLLGLESARLRRWLFARCVLGAGDAPELAAVASRIAPA